VFIVVVDVTDSVQKLQDTPSYVCNIGILPQH